MFPYIQLFGRQLGSYGLLILLGAYIGVALAVFFPYDKSLARDDILYASLFATIGVVVGGKILYIISLIPTLVRHKVPFSAAFRFFVATMGQGFVFYGGLLGGIFMIYLYAKIFGGPFFSMLETIAVSGPLIHAFGRIGCFAAGCCYGTPTDSWFSVIFPEGSFGLSGVPLFPVQLVEAGINLVLFVLLFLYSRKKRRPGQVIGLYLIFYSIMRFVLEFYRGDIIRGIAGSLSTSQWISLVLLPLGCILFFTHIPERLMAKSQQRKTKAHGQG